MPRTKKPIMAQKLENVVAEKENISDNVEKPTKTKEKTPTSDIYESDNHSAKSMEQDEPVTALVQNAVPVVKFGSRSSNEVRKPPRSMSQKAGLEFPVFKILTRLKKGEYAKKIKKGAAVYLAGALEYLASEALELSGNCAIDLKKKRIIPRHLMLALRNDDELGELLKDVVFAKSGVPPRIHSVLLQKKSSKKRKSSKAMTRAMIVDDE